MLSPAHVTGRESLAVINQSSTVRYLTILRITESSNGWSEIETRSRHAIKAEKRRIGRLSAVEVNAHTTGNAEISRDTTMAHLVPAGTS